MTKFDVNAHKAEIADIFQEYTFMHKSTAPIDHKTAYEAIRRLYLYNNFRPPEKFFYVKSPVEAAIIAKIFCTSNENELWEYFWRATEDMLPCEATKWGWDDELLLDLWCLPQDFTSILPLQFAKFHNDEEVFNNIWNGVLSRYWEASCAQNWKRLHNEAIKQEVPLASRGFLGLWDFVWMFTECARRIGVPFNQHAITMLTYINEIVSSCGFSYLYCDFAIVCDRPATIYHDALGRIHNESGMAIKFSDGSGVYALNGINFPEHVVLRPEEITKIDVYKEKNSEVRRILIERMGAQKFANLFNAKPVHEDNDILGNSRRLLKVEMMEGDWFAIEVTDSSKTKDENGNWRNKKYLLPVNPIHYNGRAGRECHAAIASTWRHGHNNTKLFFKRPEDYVPVLET